MKKKMLLFAALVLASSLCLHAERPWRVFGGLNVSHGQRDLGARSAYGVGAFAGVGYEVKLSRLFSITPQFNLQYANGENLRDHSPLIYDKSYFRVDYWADLWSFQLPVMVDLRTPLTDDLKFRLSVGPYIETVFNISNTYYTKKEGVESPWTKEKQERQSMWFDNYDVSFLGEVAVEQSNGLGYFLRAKAPGAFGTWGLDYWSFGLGVQYRF